MGLNPTGCGLWDEHRWNAYLGIGVLKPHSKESRHFSNTLKTELGQPQEASYNISLWPLKSPLKGEMGVALGSHCGRPICLLGPIVLKEKPKGAQFTMLSTSSTVSLRFF